MWKLFLKSVVGLSLSLAAWAFVGVSTARTMTLSYTIPKYSAATFISEDSTLGVSCGPDTTNLATDLQFIRIYRQPYSGGGFKVYRNKYVVGRGGQPDTSNVPDDGNYYTTAVDFTGNESCASTIVHGFVPTGVPTEPVAGVTLRFTRLFTVNGALANPPLASGIYFRLYVWSDGSRTMKRELVLK